MQSLALDSITDLVADELAPLTTFEEVGDKACRWPTGPKMLDCCGRAVAKGSYCTTHAKRAYRRHVSEETREVLGENFKKLLRSHKFSSAPSGMRVHVQLTAEELGL